MINKVNCHFEEINKNKYLMLIRKKLKNMKNRGGKSDI